jgi:hypothetical protein
VIRVVCKNLPRGALFNTLGVAEYRMGNYELAIAACKRSLELSHVELNLSGPQAVDLAFLAMSHLRLGNTTDANLFREQFLESMQSKMFKDDSECRSFAQELEALFATNSSPLTDSPKRP